MFLLGFLNVTIYLLVVASDNNMIEPTNLALTYNAGIPHTYSTYYEITVLMLEGY